MTYLDIRIQELMDEADAHLTRSSQPLGWLGLVRSMARGRLGWTVWAIWIGQLLLFLGAIYAAVLFFRAEDVMVALKTGLSAATLAIVAVQIKMTIAPHMQAERILRALKRVEILILAQNAKK